MGIINSALGRGLSAAGGALEVIGVDAAKSTIDELRQSRLMELSQQFQGTRDDKMMAHQSAESQLTRDQQTTLADKTDKRITAEGAATRGLQERLATLTNDRIKEENQLNREQQLQLHRERMAQTAAALKNSGLSLQTTDAGLAVVDIKNNTVTPLKDAAGNPIKGAKQDDSIKVLEAIGHLSKNLEGSDPELAKKLGAMALTILAPRVPGAKGPAIVDPFAAKPGQSAAPAGGRADSPAAPSSALVDVPPGTVEPATDEEIAAVQAAGPGRARVGGRGMGVIEREMNNRNTVY